MSDLAAWTGGAFAVTLTTVTRIEGGWLRADLSPGEQLAAKPVQTPGEGPSRPTRGNRVLDRRRRSDLGGAFEHIAQRRPDPFAPRRVPPAYKRGRR